MDKVISKIVALGVPGLVLLVAKSATGFTGAAAITTSLSALGGPLGMLGGIAGLVLLSMIASAITEFGFDKIFSGVIKELYRKGETKESILNKINNYPISASLKRKLKELIDDEGFDNSKTI